MKSEYAWKMSGSVCESPARLFAVRNAARGIFFAFSMIFRSSALGLYPLRHSVERLFSFVTADWPFARLTSSFVASGESPSLRLYSPCFALTFASNSLFFFAK